MQGRLAPQDPADEPASVLLGRIREERRRLIAEGRLKAPKGGESVIYRASDGSYYEKRVDAKGHGGEPACIDDEIPFANYFQVLINRALYTGNDWLSWY